jgi:hypothetical protein
MSEPAQLLYLEPDDEITSVVRRLRETDAGRVVLVAPGRSRVTTSAVALRLLAGVAAEEGREIALVSDAAGRALAAEAGIDAFPSVAEADAENPVPPEPPPPRRAPIRVVRGEEARVTALPATAAAPGSADETMAVPVAVPTPVAGPAEQPAPVRTPKPRVATAPVRRRTFSRAAIGALVILLVLAVAGAAAIAPAATVIIEPASVPIEEARYTLTLPATGVDEGELTAEVQGSATGIFRDPSPATGRVVFENWNTSPVRVDAGTPVAAGDVVFETTETIVVPTGFFGIPGSEDAGVVAAVPGPAGNLPADAIDAILDDEVRNALRAFSDNPNRLVRNEEATAGGSDNEQPQVRRRDVAEATQALGEDLADQLQGALVDEPGFLYAEPQVAEPIVDVPDDLVGRRGEETFTLAGRLPYERARVAAEDVEESARSQLLDDPDAAPRGRSILEDSIQVDVRRVTQSADGVEVRVTVTALAEPIIDVGAVRSQVSGLTADEAERALADLGGVEVSLWPGWVDRAPGLEWRIDVQVSP